MIKRFVGTVIFVLIMGSGLLLACSPQLRVGWAGSVLGDQIQYRYSTFSGTERASIQAEAGQELTVTYDITVDKGTLTLRVINPQDTILWEERYPESGEGETSVALTEDGLHEIVVEGNDTSGSFDISWDLEEP